MSTAYPSAFAKTALGIDELRTRRHGLPPRVRQLLILIDGQRTETQLARLIPRAELDDYLPTLEGGGFIVRTGTPPPGARALAAQPAPEAEPGDPHDEMRKRVVAALVEIAGTHGQELAGRIERCQSRRALREILPAARAIVEIVGGERAVAQFEERAGLR